jgi:hypothetical protein
VTRNTHARHNHGEIQYIWVKLFVLHGSTGPVSELPDPYRYGYGYGYPGPGPDLWRT